MPNEPIDDLIRDLYQAKLRGAVKSPNSEPHYQRHFTVRRWDVERRSKRSFRKWMRRRLKGDTTS